jgi:hypothetical protein
LTNDYVVRWLSTDSLLCNPEKHYRLLHVLAVQIMPPLLCKTSLHQTELAIHLVGKPPCTPPDRNWFPPFPILYHQMKDALVITD